MKIMHRSTWFALSLALLMAACHPKPEGTVPTGGVRPLPPDTVATTGGVKPPRPPSAVELQYKLVTQYQRGEVEQCMHKGQVIYRCSLNAPDAGSEIYNVYGERIARCYPSTGVTDPVCKEATECKVIYRMARNIWGKPEVPWVKPE